MFFGDKIDGIEVIMIEFTKCLHFKHRISMNYHFNKENTFKKKKMKKKTKRNMTSYDVIASIWVFPLYLFY